MSYLFATVGMSSDIMELFYLFDEEPVARDGKFGYAILTLWSASLLQFPLVLTMTDPNGGATTEVLKPKGINVKTPPDMNTSSRNVKISKAKDDQKTKSKVQKSRHQRMREAKKAETNKAVIFISLKV